MSRSMRDGEQSMASTKSLQQRLKLNTYDREQTIATINGTRLADALGLPLLRIAAVRGIRYTPGFAEELYGLDTLFSRAINARRIMSNIIPDAMAAEEVPYCIWHPDVATEDCYRRLVQAHPNMRYQVARACAVAGYITLYKELHVLPDTHVAEEARESGNLDIFTSIMSHDVLFSVMNDYDRTINTIDPQVARLNGDTSVRNSLDYKQCFSDASPGKDDEDDFGFGFDFFEPSPGFRERMFNITEDHGIAIAVPDDDEDVQANEPYFNSLTPVPAPAWIEYMWAPLPRDLQFMNKDMLIRKAAYDGDIDRYTRLRRPVMVPGELDCCLRGVYHNTMFAVWWSKQDLSIAQSRKLRSAIYARFIMNNVLREDVIGDPYLIWYPTIASIGTYRELAKRRPDMLPQIIRACIVADYVAYSTSSRLEKILGEQKPIKLMHDDWKVQLTSKLMPSSIWIRKDLASISDMYNDSGETLYGRSVVSDANFNLYACLPEQWLVPPRDEDGFLPEWKLDYVNFPSETYR